MISKLNLLLGGSLILLTILAINNLTKNILIERSVEIPQVQQTKNDYWLILHRKSNQEELLQGNPGIQSKSRLIKTFNVKSGIPGQRPTPLPQLLGRQYWLIVEKLDTSGSLETAPFFLKLDIPYVQDYPFGPTPYPECEGQCNWQIPGSFGLHGVAGDNSKLSAENPGSSGCIRHTDEDITYLYNTLDLTQEVRFYIEDN